MTRDQKYKKRHPDRVLASKRRWRKEHSEERKAHSALNNAVVRGKIIKPDCCEGCGAKGIIHGHHKDYSKPLEVEWLCPPCHGKKFYE